MAPPDPFAERYSNLRFVGRGAFGAVYRADDLKMKCVRALKLLNPELAGDRDWRERFQREATSAAGLAHPNITVVFDEGVYQDQPFIVMEFVEGEPLSSIIERRVPLSDPERLNLIEQLCDGLHYAHKRGVVHRDVKPVNLVVREEQEGSHTVRTLKILDFGIAKVQSAGGTLTGGQLLFTPNYVAPEQIRGLDADPRSDMFAVGAVAYELFLFRKAFIIRPKSQFELFEEIKRKILEEPHTPMSAIRADIDPELASIVDRALAKDPDKRYRDLAQMRRHLAKVRERLEQEMPPEDDEGGRTVKFDAVVHEHARLARQAMAAEDPASAVLHFERAMAAAPNDTIRSALAAACGEARAALRFRQEDAAHAAIAAATSAFRSGEIAAAIRMLETFEPVELVVDGVAKFKRVATAVERAIASVETGPPDERQEALRALDGIPERTLVGPVLERLRDVDASRASLERHDAAATAAIESARRMFEAGDRPQALATLVRFHPPHGRVSDVLSELRERDVELDAQEVAAAEAAVAQARADFASARRGEAIETLAAFRPAELVGSTLDELRRADEAIRATSDVVLHGPPEGRRRALEQLLAWTPRDLVAGAHGALQAIAASRTAEEDRAEKAAEKRALAAATAARATFQRGAHGEAIRELEAFADVRRVAGVLTLLRAGAAEVAAAREAVRIGAEAERTKAIERLASFEDADLVAKSLAEVRSIAGQRLAEEAADRAAETIVREARGLFEHGDRPEALTRLREFRPAHRRVTAALAELTDLSNQLDREQAADRAGREARALEARKNAAQETIRRAEDFFKKGQRDDAIELLEGFAHADLVSAELATLRRVAAVLEEIEHRVQTGDGPARDAAVESLAAVQPSALIAGSLASLRELNARRAAEERRAGEEAAAADAVQQAQALFGDGHHDEAIALLDRHPVPALVADVRRDLERKRQQIESEHDRDEANAVLLEARRMFAGGEAQGALKRLAAFRIPGLVEEGRQELLRAEAAIAAAQKRVAKEDAEGRRAAIEELGRRTPPELFAHALSALRRKDEDRTAEALRLEEARRVEQAKVAAQEKLERELRDRAEDAVRLAQERFAAGDRESAVALLEGFTPAHPIVDTQLDELKIVCRVQDLVTGAEIALASGHAAEAKVAVAEALRLRRADPAAQAVLQRVRAVERAALVRRLKPLAVWALASVLLVASAVGVYQYWPGTSESLPPPSAASEKQTPPVEKPTPAPSPPVLPPPDPTTVATSPTDVTIDARPWARFEIRPVDANSKQDRVTGTTPHRLNLLPGEYVVELENGGLTKALTARMVVTSEPGTFAFTMPGFNSERAVTDLVGPDR